jgi:glycosyltransferase involved in cell wall biosynthesis
VGWLVDAPFDVTGPQLDPRLVVLVLIGSYLPGFHGGGPVRSIKHLTEALRDEFDFLIATADRDLGSPVPYEGVRTGEWSSLDGCRVMYLRPADTGLAIWRLLRDTPHDVVYCNSFFSPKFTILPLLLRWLPRSKRAPVIIAPRGEFSPGALELKGMKKRLWLMIFKLLRLGRDAIWHATTVEEAQLIKATMGHHVKTVIASNLTRRGTGAPPLPASTSKQPGVAKIVFLSRISPKKNVQFAISLVGAAQAGKIVFDIYGPLDDPGYWLDCKRQIASLRGEDVSINYMGDAEHSQVPGILARYDLFLFPTLGENFGHAIFEALAAGCPVAVSDQTPWQDIESAGAGWVISLTDVERWREAVSEIIASDPPSIGKRRAAARLLAQRRSSTSEDVERSRQLFRSVMAMRPVRRARLNRGHEVRPRPTP